MTDSKYKPVKQRVQAGIDWLDKTEGKGKWEMFVSIKYLNMKNPCRCVLGGIYDSVAYTRSNLEDACWTGFGIGKEMLNEQNLSAVDLGFDAIPGYYAVDFDSLKEEWIRRLAERGYKLEVEDDLC